MEKYLIASSGDNLDSKISARFGHAACFILVDPQSMEYEVYPGVSANEKSPSLARFINLGITKILCGNIGPSTFSEAQANRMNVYLCRKMSVREAVTKVANEEISPLDEPTLKQSIHSAQKNRGEGRGLGRIFKSRGNRRSGKNQKEGGKGKGFGKGKSKR